MPVTEFTSSLENTLFDLFDDETIKRGRLYINQGRVSIISVEQNECLIRGKVKGFDKFYMVKINLNSEKNKYDDIYKNDQIYCPCRSEHHCAHAAAVLLAVMANHSLLHKTRLPPLDSSLNSSIVSWLDDVISASKPKNKNSEEQSLFVLKVVDTNLGKLPAVTTLMAKILKNGSLGKPRHFAPNTESQFKRIPIKERRVFTLIQACMEHYTQESCILAETGCEILIEQLIQTGHCYWQTTESEPLVFGEKQSATLAWEMQENGLQKPVCHFQNPHCILIPFQPFWYVDTLNHCIGKVEMELSDQLVASLLKSPALDPVQAKQVSQLIQNKITLPLNKVLPIPEVFHEVREEQISPVPCLHLSYENVPLYHRNTYNPRLALAQVFFQYEKIKVPFGDTSIAINQLKEGVLCRSLRKDAEEKKYIQTLLQHDVKSMTPITNQLFMSSQLKKYQYHFLMDAKELDNQMKDFSLHSIPELKAAGWKISWDTNYPYPPVETIDEWYSDLSETSEYEWFNFELGVMINNERINLLPALLKLIKRTDFSDFFASILKNEKDDFILEISDKRFISVPYSRLANILNILYEFYSPKAVNEENLLRVSRLRASLLIEMEKALESSKLRWFGGNKILELGRKLQNFTGITSVNIPVNFNTTLRPYQQEGVNWLQFLRDYQLNGILADDMGLGKTVQALAHILIEKEAGRLTKPCLIIAPTSVITNWQIEATRFAPSLKVLILHGNQRKDHFSNLNDYDLIITTYHLLVRDTELLTQHLFYLIILDEAQYIKNSQAKMTQIVQQLQADHRLCLTGTPLENHLGELWSLYHFLMPGLLGNTREFTQRYRTPIEKNNDLSCRKRLSQTLKPFMLRRTKSQVVQDLPEKNEIISHVELEGKQRDLYESIRLAMHDKVQKAIDEKGVERSQIIILDALLKLRQVCCDPRLLSLESAKKVEESAKLELLMDMVPALIQEGRRILLFSQFTSMLELIEVELAKHKIDYIKLTGETRDRQSLVDRFQSKEVPLFLISLKAGGTGLNLTAADTVIHYDPWWNPAAENQATDRAHRIGQDKTVFVYKLVTKGTVEEKILAMQEKKRNIAEGVFDASQNQSGISRHDFESLFN